MKLHHLDFGGAGKPPLLILHGLMGSSRNWRSAGMDLSVRFHVCALDLRNHGLSPHAAEQSFDLMAADVFEWLDDRRIERASLLGHSLGGKVAMLVACRAPQRVTSLHVVDIAPKAYPVDARAFEAMLGLDLKTLATRRAADEALRTDIPDAATRQFLLMNLKRDERDQLAWRVNLPAIVRTLPAIRASPLDPLDRFDGKTLFVVGGRSRFVAAEDHGAILGHFPLAVVRTIPHCAHSPHVEDRAAFVRTVLEFEAGGPSGCR